MRKLWCLVTTLFLDLNITCLVWLIFTKTVTTWKVSVFGVFWSVYSCIWTDWGDIQFKCGKLWTRKTPHMDTFRAASLLSLIHFRSLVICLLNFLSDISTRGILASSVKWCTVLNSAFLSRSLINNSLKRRGFRTNPCGTPYFNSLLL